MFDAARRAGVPRVVYGGSNHAIGFTPRSELLPADGPLRPDTNYGVSKAFGEVVGRFYADRYGMRVACLRIGSCDDRPRTPRWLSTWLSPGDAVRLVDACLRAPDLGYAVVYGISANTRGWWDLAAGACARLRAARQRRRLRDRGARARTSRLPPMIPTRCSSGGRWTTVLR